MGRNTDLYRLKESSTSTDLMGANFIFAMLKRARSAIAYHLFRNGRLRLIFGQFRPGFLTVIVLYAYILKRKTVTKFLYICTVDKYNNCTLTELCKYVGKKWNY